jgi:SAM-dependent methyltransferase
VLGVGAGAAYLAARHPRRAAAALAALVAVTILVDDRPSLAESRTFFGVYRVRTDDRGRHVFEHGTTIHGQQYFDPDPRTEPLTYYTRDSGVGRLFDALHEDGRDLDVGVVGLGAGTLAAYGRPGDRIDFFEIDGEVVRLAADPDLFTFLRDSPATVTTTVGDGRLALAEGDRPLDLLVLDAFSSDAIPVHLLTAEAMQEYRRRLAPGGVIAVHISNRFFDLAPIVARLGEEIGFDAHRRDTPVSSWMLLSPTDAPNTVTAETRRWDAVQTGPDVPLWTDDFSNLLSALQ